MESWVYRRTSLAEIKGICNRILCFSLMILFGVDSFKVNIIVRSGGEAEVGCFKPRLGFGVGIP